MFQRIDAVAIHVKDWQNSLRWYQDNLDLAPFHIEEDHAFAVLGLSGGGAVLHLVGDGTAARTVASRCMPMIAVEDFDAALTRLRSNGVEILDVVDDAEDGYRLATIADPEQNSLGIYKM